MARRKVHEESSAAIAPATLASGSRIPFLKTLGVTLREIGERHAVMRVRVDARHRNFFGGVHGGLLATLVDTVCFFPRPLLPSGRAITTASLSVSYVRAPKVGDVLTARSELLHLGRRTASLTARVEDAAGRLLAHGSATLLMLDAPTGERPPKRRNPRPRKRKPAPDPGRGAARSAGAQRRS
jgi:acyl-CoA thioesterase